MEIKYLYAFDSNEFGLVEIKRTDLEKAGAEIDKVYHWLLIEKKTNEVTKLSFKSMDETDLKSFRTFFECDLEFDKIGAKIKNLNGKSIDFSVLDFDDISNEMQEVIEKWCG